MLNLPVIIQPALPEIFAAVSAMVLLVIGVLGGNKTTRPLIMLTMMVMVVTAVFVFQGDWSSQVALNGYFISDSFSALVKILILVGMIACLGLSARYMDMENISRFEFPVLTLFATLGMLMMVSANDLLSLYIGLELQSLSLYVLASFRRNSLKSAEAGLKYFVLGALSSGMILFGSSIIYGFAGTTAFDGIDQILNTNDAAQLGITMGLVFVLAGLAFKISAVPFHMWTPDVYEGAPTHVTALFAIVPKLAAMALLMRLLLVPFEAVSDQWTQIIWILAAASMIVGAFAGLKQENIKRLLAYSSIGNMGYALMGLLAATPEGSGAMMFYFVTYMAMSAGVFGIIMSLRSGNIAVEQIDRFAGLSKTHPLSAYALAILLFSMSGIPPMAGFFGKMFVFQAAIDSGYIVLAVLGVITSVVAAYYYLRVIKTMFFDEPIETLERDEDFARTSVVFVSVFIVLLLILSPETILLTCRAAAGVLF